MTYKMGTEDQPVLTTKQVLSSRLDFEDEEMGRAHW